LEFAKPESGVHRRSPGWTVACRYCGDERHGFGGVGNALAPTADCRERESVRGVDSHEVVSLRIAVERTSGVDRVANRRGVSALRLHPVDELLEVRTSHVGEPSRSEVAHEA
jgi:hypothetical protein